MQKIFVNELSGAISSRPGLQQAIDTLRVGDVLVVWRLDRFRRSLRNLIELVICQMLAISKPTPYRYVSEEGYGEVSCAKSASPQLEGSLKGRCPYPRLSCQGQEHETI